MNYKRKRKQLPLLQKPFELVGVEGFEPSE